MQRILQHRCWPERTARWRGNQGASLLILGASWGLVQCFVAGYGQVLPEGGAVWLQALLAAVLSLCLAQPWWWLLINGGFLPAVHYALALHWPAWLFLLALVLLGLSFGAMFLTRVPFFPSCPAVWSLVAALLPEDKPCSVLDMGSGTGGLCLHLAERRPNCQVVGVEWAFLPWLLSDLRARRRGSASRFIRGDFRRHSLAGYDLVFVYLSPAFMPNLWEKACREMKPGAWLVSCEFAVAGQVAQPLPGSAVPGVPPVYAWRIGASAPGHSVSACL